MRIGIDARYAFRRERRGIGRSLANLLRALAEADTANEYILYLDRLASPRQVADFRGARWLLKVLPARNPLVWEQVALPLAARRDRIDVLHCPANMAPLVQSCPTILTLYDVIEFRRSAFQRNGLSLRHRLSRLYRMGSLPRAARSAVRVVTASQYSAKDICEVLRVDASRVRVIPIAIDPFFFEQASPESTRRTMEKLSIRGDCILALAALDRRKNTACVLESFALLRRRGVDARLVLVGSEDVRRQGLESHHLWPEVMDRVTLLSYISDHDLKHLYHAARVFVYPSLYEGFGLPPLEAMACGTPVVCSNATSLPEVVGDAALLFDPRSPEALAEAVEALWHDEGLRRVMAQRGRRRAQTFSWLDIARQTLDLYHEVCHEAVRDRVGVRG